MSKHCDDSRARPAALFLTPEAPYPIAGGGPMRSASILEYLASRYSVDVIVFREPGAADPAASFPPGKVRNIVVVDLPFHSKELPSRVLRNAGRFARGAPPLVDRFAGFEKQITAALHGRHYEVAFLEHFWVAAYGGIVRRHSTQVVLDLHNVESLLLSRCAQTESWLSSKAFKRFAASCRELERKLLPEFSTLLVSSPDDAESIALNAPAAQVVVYPNAIPFIPQPNGGKSNEIVFSGNLEYHPNRSAIDYFHRNIWPSLSSQWPDLVWRLVGRNHERCIKQFAREPRIKVEGPVDDAIRALASSKVAIAPILAGSGTRIKIIEAWAAGLPVVSTSLGAEGLPGERGKHLLIADSPTEFAEGVSSLLGNSELSAHLGSNGRQLYEEKLTWNAAWQQLEAAGF